MFSWVWYFGCRVFGRWIWIYVVSVILKMIRKLKMVCQLLNMDNMIWLILGVRIGMVMKVVIIMDMILVMCWFEVRLWVMVMVMMWLVVVVLFCRKWVSSRREKFGVKVQMMVMSKNNLIVVSIIVLCLNWLVSGLQKIWVIENLVRQVVMMYC